MISAYDTKLLTFKILLVKANFELGKELSYLFQDYLPAEAEINVNNKFNYYQRVDEVSMYS